MNGWIRPLLVAATLAASSCGEVTATRSSDFRVSGPAADVQQFVEAERVRDPGLKVVVTTAGAEAEAVFDRTGRDENTFAGMGERAAAAKLSFGYREEMSRKATIGSPDKP